MKGFLALLCSAALLFNGIAVAGGGLGRGLVAEKHGVGKLVSKLTQGAGTLAVAALLACGISGCSSDEIADKVRMAEDQVTTLNYDHNTSIDEIMATIEQTEGAQIGVVRSVDEQGTLVIETNDGDVTLQLDKGEVLVNNGEAPVKVTLIEEVIDQGWIKEGSWIAIIPAVAVAGGLLFMAGSTLLLAGDTLLQEYFHNHEMAELLGGAAIFTYAAASMGTGTYHLIVML